MLNFIQWVTEDEHSRLLKREVGKFFRKNPKHREGLHDPDKAAGTCWTVSDALRKHLRKKKVDASLVSARHSLTPIEPDAHHAYGPKGIPSEKMYHWGVRSGEHVIDTTGAQFGKKYAGPQVMSVDDFKKRWKTVG